MPAPSVGPQLVGKNATITVGASAVRHGGGSLTVGGGTDTVTYPNGFDHSTATNANATGTFQLIVEYGEAVPIVAQTHDTLVIADGTYEQFDGEAYFESVTQQFANDQGWTFEVTWRSHGAFTTGGTVA